MISFTNYDKDFENFPNDEPIYFLAEDQTWDDDTIKELKEEYNVIYTHGIQATMLIKSKCDGRILITVGFEDDGCIQFPRQYNQFTHCYFPYWIDSNMKLLQCTKEFVEDCEKSGNTSNLMAEVI